MFAISLRIAYNISQKNAKQNHAKWEGNALERYIVFDVETPNHRNHRISAIGLAVVENGRIVQEIDRLVDPETEFDYFNVMLTGIRPEDVEGAPNFPQLWEEIGSIMDSGILVAHNAAFDMSVLAKCLRYYDMEGPVYRSYACTCTMGRACFPHLPDHKLNTLCACRGIALDHHRAGSDSRACAELLVDYVN